MMENHAPSVDFIIVDGSPDPVPISSEYGCNYFWEAIPELGIQNAIQIITSIDGEEPTVYRIRRYKEKVGKSDDVNTPIKVEEIMSTQFRYRQVGWKLGDWPLLNIKWGMKAVAINPTMKTIGFENGVVGYYSRLISCIPLPIMSSIVGLEWNVHCKPIYVSVFQQRLNIDFMTVDYNSDLQDHVYRSTRFENNIQYESLERFKMVDLEGIQVEEMHKLWPGKIYPTNESKEVCNSIREHGIFCLGRYATWETDQLLHEAANVARSISREMGGLFNA